MKLVELLTKLIRKYLSYYFNYSIIKFSCNVVCGNLLLENDPYIMEKAKKKVPNCVKTSCREYERLINKNTAVNALW